MLRLQLEKCAHRRPTGVRERQTCITALSLLLNSGSVDCKKRCTYAALCVAYSRIEIPHTVQYCLKIIISTSPFYCRVIKTSKVFGLISLKLHLRLHLYRSSSIHIKQYIETLQKKICELSSICRYKSVYSIDVPIDADLGVRKNILSRRGGPLSKPGTGSARRGSWPASWSAADMAKWRSRCSELLARVRLTRCPKSLCQGGPAFWPARASPP
jgi:hypothetical protein